MPKYTSASAQTRPDAKAPRNEARPTFCTAARSAARVSASHSRSGGVSQLACVGPSGNITRQAAPNTMAGTASSSSIHCHALQAEQALQSQQHARDRTPNQSVSGMPTMKSPMTRARSASGNQ